MRTALHLQAVSGFDPEIGRWLAALQEIRTERTIPLLRDLDQQLLDWRGPDGDENSIGSLLYHIGIVEMSWLYLDILEREALPPAVLERYPEPMSDQEKRLTFVGGISTVEHLDRLARSREWLLHELRGMTLEDWRRPRSPGDVEYTVTPEWAIFHLVEHEAGHAFQIASLRHRAWRHFGRAGS